MKVVTYELFHNSIEYLWKHAVKSYSDLRIIILTVLAMEK